MEKTQKSDAKAKESKKKSSGINKKLIFPITLVLLVAGVVAWYLFSNNLIGSSSSPSSDETVARVNGEQISRSELNTTQQQIAASQGNNDPLAGEDDASQKQAQTEALNALIAQTLIKQEVEKSNINVSQEDINAQIDSIKSQFETQDAFEEALSSQGFSENELRIQIQSQLATQAYFDQVIDTEGLTATDTEIEEFYQQSVAQGEEAPALEDVRSQIEQVIVQQKQQEKISELIDKLRSEADIEILI